MSFTTDEINRAGHYSLDVVLRKDPTDQIGTDHPLLQALLGGRKPLAGGLQYIKQQVLKDYGSNYQRYSGDDQQTYNKRDLLDDAYYPWAESFDGFTLNKTELRQNGVVVTEGGGTKTAPTADDKIRLHDLLDTNLNALTKGFNESRDLEFHRDGTQDTKALVGLDGLVRLDPTTGTVGGLDSATKTYWRNYAKTAIDTSTQGTLLGEIQKAERSCMTHGGKWNLILAGADWIDAFRKDAKGDITAYQVVGQKGGYGIDPGVTYLAWNGTPIVYDPVSAALDAADSPAIAWAKRAYFLQMPHLTYMADKPMNCKPPRVYDRFTWYWGLQVTDALVSDRLSGHAVLAIS